MTPTEPPIPEESQGIIQRSPLEILLPDAIRLARKAETIAARKPSSLDDMAEAGMYARSSILASAHAIEAVANCCLERGLSLRDTLLRRIRRWPTAEKIDFYLHEIRKGPLDWGHLAAQRSSELIRIRNAYVHPSFIEQQTTVRKLPRGGTVLEPDFTVTKTSFLKIPENPRKWDSTHAVHVIHAALDFLDLLFVDVCGFTSNRVAQLICDRIDSKLSSGEMADQLYSACYEIKASWGLEPKCMKWLFDEMDRRNVRFPDR